MQGHLLANLSSMFFTGDVSDMLTPFRGNGLPSWAKATDETLVWIQWHFGPDLYSMSQMCHVGMTCLLKRGMSQVQYMFSHTRGRT